MWLMRKSVSVPEKTLEHWSSQYITYRYPSQAALWWPASGEDINVGCLPARPGMIVVVLSSSCTIFPGLAGRQPTLMSSPLAGHHSAA